MLARILVIDSDPGTAHLIKYCLGRSVRPVELELYHPSRGLPASDVYLGKFDLIVLEYQLGLHDQTGLDWLGVLRGQQAAPAVVMLTGRGSENVAVQALKQGAHDYFNKEDLSPRRFCESIEELEKNKHAGVDGGSRSGRTRVQDTLKTHSSQMHSRVSGKGGTTRSHGPVERSASAAPRATETAGPFHVEIPGYTVLRDIGSGAMANIFLAHRNEDGLQVVLKILPFEEEENPELLKRFMREYNLLSMLNHPCVAKVFERGFAPNLAYIAMEYFPAGDLKNKLQTPTSTTVTVRYLRQIISGLGAVHAVDIIHRDLKPANILFRNENDLAITDFGIARNTRALSTLTDGHALMGTAYYMSPEVISRRRLDKRSDLYSLGVMLYRMLTRTHPYRGSSPGEVFRGHLESPIPRLPLALSVFQSVIDGLLAKDPDDRFQTTDDLLAGLEWVEQKMA
jgi:tRNA A-37 threonylcarbamoyl transferase component Bud32/CheY-like chemotaxis protein